MRTKLRVRTRSTSVIVHETESVERFCDPVSHVTFDIRRLTAREKREHFIVILADYDKSNIRIKPVAEVYFSAEKPRFMVDIKNQYPDLNDRANFIKEKIINSVSCYEKAYAQNFSTAVF
ncbi:hypothetical protein [Vibrio sp.]|jgi:hypothetical protein|uniref:hypothetical protein n=1 Tax=Vibrio sp. TaxID=678 RepID=UPI003F6ADBED